MEDIILKIKLFAVIIFCICLTSCLKEDKLKLPFESYVPKQLNDGWELSTPAQEGINEAELKKIYKYYHESKDLWQVRSLLVFRNNKLVAESYAKNPDEITQTVPMWSCTKQVTGLLTGIAIEQGIIDDMNDNLQKYLPEEIARYPNKGAITIQNLLKMESGIAFENSGFNGESNQLLRELHDNSLEFILGLPISFAPGEDFYYNDADPHIISAILQRRTSKTMRDWAKEVLFTKVNFQNYTWVTYKDGITMGSFGISSTPREMAKIGHLVLNKGSWNGEQIVNSTWIEEMTSSKVSVEKTKSWGKSFGYQWWVDERRGVFFMAGKGGQYVFIKPSKNLVMVTTADPNDEYMFEMDTALDIFDRIDKITTN
ncbi:MAG: beta-lactamase family protein [Bacteroidetes bacterium]|nr:beta-lactamase family protein [Bacteroidota bacterium]MCL2301796.1 beta-lactamase family protein [Lentimicrobiaceae bacterium]